MRNLVEFPVTKEEVVSCLLDMANDLVNVDPENVLIGDMRPLILRIAAVALSALDEDSLNLKL